MYLTPRPLFKDSIVNGVIESMPSGALFLSLRIYNNNPMCLLYILSHYIVLHPECNVAWPSIITRDLYEITKAHLYIYTLNILVFQRVQYTTYPLKQSQPKL